MSGVERFETSEFLSVLFDMVSELEQQPATFSWRSGAPMPVARSGRGIHGAVHVLPPGHRNLRDGGIVVRIQRGQRRAVGGVDELSADEQLGSNRTRGLGSHVRWTLP